MKLLQGVLQVTFLTCILLVSNVIAKYFHMLLPGSIVGLIILFLLLRFGAIKVEWIERGANWLLAELLLFFIPSTIGVVNYQQVIGAEGLKLIIIILFSSLTVMASTGLAAQFFAQHRKDLHHESAFNSH